MILPDEIYMIPIEHDGSPILARVMDKNMGGITVYAKEPQWQPIETAPNMEDCLIYSNREIFSAYKNKQGQWIAPDPHGVGQCFILNMPTHWMPLPPAPRGKE